MRPGQSDQVELQVRLPYFSDQELERGATHRMVNAGWGDGSEGTNGVAKPWAAAEPEANLPS